jgi:Protein of unknown function (DUF2924)
MKSDLQLAKGEELARQIAGLSDLSVKELKDKWREVYGSEPHRRISRELLTRALAYRLQERALGRVKPATARLLERIGERRSQDDLANIASLQKTSPGTVLIREWRGVSHRVTVLDGGVVYRGRRHKSLSEVARAITGTRWSGPLFFGIKGQKKEAQNG